MFCKGTRTNSPKTSLNQNGESCVLAFLFESRSIRWWRRSREVPLPVNAKWWSVRTFTIVRPVYPPSSHAGSGAFRLLCGATLWRCGKVHAWRPFQ